HLRHHGSVPGASSSSQCSARSFLSLGRGSRDRGVFPNLLARLSRSHDDLDQFPSMGAARIEHLEVTGPRQVHDSHVVLRGTSTFTVVTEQPGTLKKGSLHQHLPYSKREERVRGRVAITLGVLRRWASKEVGHRGHRAEIAFHRLGLEEIWRAVN